ncbi:MAG: hypothetical protein ACREIT_04110 [Tepidisphaeraceae bacterium]
MRKTTPKDRKTRGRTSITGARNAHPDTIGPNPTKPNIPQVVRRETTRPVSAGSGKLRGDRRDTSRLYTGNTKHAARGNNPREDVKTRKR